MNFTGCFPFLQPVLSCNWLITCSSSRKRGGTKPSSLIRGRGSSFGIFFGTLVDYFDCDWEGLSKSRSFGSRSILHYSFHEQAVLKYLVR